MKKMMVLLLNVISLSAWAQAQRAADATAVIEAQLDVTRASVNTMVRSLDERRQQKQYNVRDYKEIAPKFQAEVERVLTVFEVNLAQAVMPRVKAVMDRYNQLHSSPEFSDQQKTTILAQQWTAMQPELEEIQKVYKSEVRKVYGALGALPFFYRFRIFEKDKKSPSYKEDQKFLHSFGLSTSGSRAYLLPEVHLFNGEVKRLPTLQKHFICTDDYGVVNSVREGSVSSMGFNASREYWGPCRNKPTGELADYSEELYRFYVYPILAEGCRSQLCVGLSIADRLFFLSRVQELIDKDIVLPLFTSRTISNDYSRPIPTNITLGKPELDTSLVTQFLKILRVPADLPMDTE